MSSSNVRRVCSLARHVHVAGLKSLPVPVVQRRRFQIQPARYSSSSNVASRNALSLGQPTVGSHPDFFTATNEIMPGICKQEFRHRRSTVCNMVTELVRKGVFRGSETNHLVIVPASSKKYMTENIPYPYRQSSNFLYLSGSLDPEAFIVLCITQSEQIHTLFLSDPDATSELWDGPRTTPTAALEHYGFDQVFVTSQLSSFMSEFARKTGRKVKIWCEDRGIADKYLNSSLGLEFKNIESPKGIIDTLRLIKSPAEINLMRQSARIASESFQEAIKFSAQTCAEGRILNERQIWAKLDYECRLRGAERLAYPPVVASGSRANIIHYVFNSNQCLPNELVLVDAGCEFFGYCSDITRTWPASGKFENDHQKSLYGMLLEMQIDLINKVEPGVSMDELFRIMSESLVKGLEELGIINKGSTGRRPGNCHEIALRFCPHHVSHFLGMDVHDTPTIERNEPLEAGMVITVEPGIYMGAVANQRDFTTKIGEEFNGIAIRIEDNVALLKNGRTVLTEDCPKTLEEIEKWGNVG